MIKKNKQWIGKKLYEEKYEIKARGGKNIVNI